MTFDDILAQVLALLQQEKRVSYRALKLRFDLNDDYIEGLKDELIYAKKLAVDEEHRVLVWTGNDEGTIEIPSQPPQSIPSLPNQSVQPAFPVVTSRTPEAERRQLTVMFCDLVDSTKLSSQLDPEDYREVVHAYQSACTEVIQRYDGHIAQLLGDGLLVYFGYPIAHEEDAQRAIHTGLRIVEAIGALHHRLERDKGIHFAVRLGIHTGLSGVSCCRRDIILAGCGRFSAHTPDAGSHAVRSAAAPRLGVPVWGGHRGILPQLCYPHVVVAGLP